MTTARKTKAGATQDESKTKAGKRSDKDRRASVSIKTSNPVGKKIRTPPVSGNTFDTTGFIVGGDVVLKITHMLIDSGALSNFISSLAVAKANLKATPCDPGTFETANGDTFYDSQVATCLIIAGIEHEVIAYVKKTMGSSHFTVGIPAMHQFRMKTLAYGPPNEIRFTVSPDTAGFRRERFVLKQDLYGSDS